MLFVQTVAHPTHPTQKPVELCEYLIKTYTRPGEVVADLCAGSGTTAVAALNTGRRFVCLKAPRPSTAPPSSALNRRGWPWSVARKENDHRTISHYLRRSPLQYQRSKVQGAAENPLPHHEYQ